MSPIVTAHTATKLADSRGKVVVCGSHGGAYVGTLAAAAGVRAIVLNDAGGGREWAGTAGLAVCQAHGIAAAAAHHTSCRIGNAQDAMARGRVSTINALAAECGVDLEMPVAEAARLMQAARLADARPPRVGEEHRSELRVGGLRVLVLDSNGLVRPGADDGAVIVTGSHGGLVGEDPASAGRAEARLFAFNDAGVGLEDAGIARLPALQARGIAAVCVDAMSARIGEGLSTYEDGVISHANAAAIALGAAPGLPLKTLVMHIAEG